jgi:hypothetical protein
VEIAQEPLDAPAAAAPTVVEEVSEPEEEEEAPPTPAPAEAAVGIGGVPMQSSSSSFHFMQESELEAAQTPFEDGAEWVERSDAAVQEAEQQSNVPPPLDLEQTKLVNGHIDESLPEVIANIFSTHSSHNSPPRQVQLIGQLRTMLASHPSRVSIPNSAHLALPLP